MFKVRLLGLNIKNISNINGYSSYQPNRSDNSSISMEGKKRHAEKIDPEHDGRFTKTQAISNFAKGFVSPITSMFSSPKHFLIGAGMIVGSAILIAATGGAAAPIFVAAGIGMGALQAGKAAIEIAQAKNGDDVERAFFDLGGATSTVGLSLIGAKTSLKQANLETKGLNALSSAKKCFTSLKERTEESCDVFKSGYFITNLKNASNLITQPRRLIKYSHELYQEGKETFATSFEALRRVLPENFQKRLIGRSKSQSAIYDKMVKERTIMIDDKIKDIRNNSNLSLEEQQQQIAQLLKQRRKIGTDSDFSKSKVEDMHGARLILEDLSPAEINKLVNALYKAVKRGDIEITEIENYRGFNKIYSKHNEFYFNKEQIAKLKTAIDEVNQKNPNTNEVINGLAPRNQGKKRGYTSLQIKIKPKNVKIPIEFQIRGSRVHEVAEWEHIPYDFIQGKDVARCNNRLGIFLTDVKKTIRGLSKEQIETYNKYIYDNYIYAQTTELGKSAIKPTLPEGINPILSAENLKLLTAKMKEFKAGVLTNPLDPTAQLAITAGTESLLSES